jgi:mannan endo-1,4-beta-mannosidase
MKNTITGIEYRHDPIIFGWELINEPRCATDPSGDTLQVSHVPSQISHSFLDFFEYTIYLIAIELQDWIEEMSTFVKSIDKKHLVTIGLEGFYGPNDPKRLTVNPPEGWASLLGSDFIRNSQTSNIDFTSVHIYPDHW